jgi:hypothetical protein
MKSSQMRREPNIGFFLLAFILFLNPVSNSTFAQEAKHDKTLDANVKIFLESHKDQWVDWNVPEFDGKVLYDLILILFFRMRIKSGTKTTLSPWRPKLKWAAVLQPIMSHQLI